MSDTQPADGDTLERLIVEICPELAATVYPDDDPPTHSALADWLREQRPGAYDHLTNHELDTYALAAYAVCVAEARGARFHPAFLESVYDDCMRVLRPESFGAMTHAKPH